MNLYNELEKLLNKNKLEIKDIEKIVLNNYELQKKATFNLLKEINNYNELIDLSFYGKHFKIIISEEYNEINHYELIASEKKLGFRQVLFTNEIMLGLINQIIQTKLFDINNIITDNIKINQIVKYNVDHNDYDYIYNFFKEIHINYNIMELVLLDNILDINIFDSGVLSTNQNNIYEKLILPYLNYYFNSN